MKEDIPDYVSLARFRHELRKFLVFSAEQARGAGLEPRQHQLLLCLRGLAPGTQPTIGALAEDLLIRHHSAVELVGRMEKKGLVRRESNDVDRRVVLVTITAHGKKLLRCLSLAHQDELRTAGPALVSVLDKVLGEHK